MDVSALTPVSVTTLYPWDPRVVTGCIHLPAAPPASTEAIVKAGDPAPDSPKPLVRAAPAANDW